MRRFLTPLGFFFLAGLACATDSIRLQEPVEIKEVFFYRDGGTTGVVLKDSKGKEVAFCFSPVRDLFYGAPHGSAGVPVAVESQLEQDILSVLQRAIDGELTAQKQKVLLGTESTAGLSKRDTDIRFVLKALEQYQVRRKRAILKKGKTELEFVNKNKGYEFRYPVAWDETEDGIQFVESRNGGAGIVLASIYVMVGKSGGLSPEQWYVQELRKYKYDAGRLNKSFLGKKVAGEIANRFSAIVLDGGKPIDIMHEIVFKKDETIYAICWINQFLKKEEFEGVLDGVLDSFKIM